jgi:hypothetical protein
VKTFRPAVPSNPNKEAVRLYRLALIIDDNDPDRLAWACITSAFMVGVVKVRSKWQTGGRAQPQFSQSKMASLQIEALLIRPIVATSAGGTKQTAALQIVAKNQDRFLVVLFGEGMKGLIADMQALLEDNPGIAMAHAANSSSSASASFRSSVSKPSVNQP